MQQHVHRENCLLGPHEHTHTHKHAAHTHDEAACLCGTAAQVTIDFHRHWHQPHHLCTGFGWLPAPVHANCHTISSRCYTLPLKQCQPSHTEHGTHTPRGTDITQLRHAWARYLPAVAISHSTQHEHIQPHCAHTLTHTSRRHRAVIPVAVPPAPVPDSVVTPRRFGGVQSLQSHPTRLRRTRSR